MVLTTRRQSRLQEEKEEDVKDGESSTLVNEVSAASSSASSSSSSSSEEGDNDSDISSNSDSDDSFDDEETLEALFQASLKQCEARDEAEMTDNTTTAFESNADEVRFGEDRIVKKTPEEQTMRKKDIKGKGREQSKELESHFQRLKRGDDLGENRPKSEARKVRERQKEREKTAGSKWFDLPAFPKSFAGKKGSLTKGNNNIHSFGGPTAEEMKREIQAIRLRNSMDPKRFYRGGNGAGDKSMPAFAQMGRIISSNLEPASTMNRSERGKTVVDEMVKDAQNAAYTKRKFGELQARTDVGRSSHISRRKSNNAGKRQRR